MVNKIHKARSSWQPSSDSKSYRETCNNTEDYRISEVPLSIVEQQDTTRENKVEKLIEKFENHKHKESFLQNFSQTHKINKFSRESHDLIADLNNTEIFELCENSSKQQCPDCNAYWEIGVIHCSCGRNMKSAQSPNRDVTSIPGYVIKKNSSRGAKHGPSRRQRMYHQAKQMLKKGPSAKARTPPNDTFTMVRQSNEQRLVVCHCVNSTPHTSHFLVESQHILMTHVAQGSSSSLACSAHFTPSHLHALMMWLF